MGYLGLLFTACLSAVGVLFSTVVSAQGTAGTYPSKPVAFILSVAAGGYIDVDVRRWTGKLNELTGQPFTIDYKPGAAGTIGAGYVAKSPPDGHTLLVVSPNFSVIPAFYKDLPFDTIKDFAPVSLMNEKATLLLASPTFAPKNFKEYLAYARANPGKINLGTAGAGGINHLTAAWMHQLTKTTVTFIHYKGGAPVVVDLLAGRADLTPTSLAGRQAQIKSGKLRALAVLDAGRNKLLPEVSAVAEDVPGFTYDLWTGVIAVGTTPPALVNRVSELLAKLAKTPEVIAAEEVDGGRSIGSTPAHFRQTIVTETARWKKLVQDTGIKFEE